MANSLMSMAQMTHAMGVLVKKHLKPRIYLKGGIWMLSRPVGRYRDEMAFKSIRHMQDYYRTGRL